MVKNFVVEENFNARLVYCNILIYTASIDNLIHSVFAPIIFICVLEDVALPESKIT